jgi:uncharacterized phage infection (PIP) family protein YhgE
METKTNAIVLTVIVMIFLFIAFVFKTNSDKKRKSLAISTAEREKDINNVKNLSQGKNPHFLGIPSWGLALLTMFLTFIVLMVLVSISTAVFKIKESNIGDLVFYILYGIVVAVCCYFIVKKNPKSIWYVPIICNTIGIIAAIVEPNFWISTSMWIPMCGGLVLSIITSIIGARVGKRKAFSDNP